MVSVNLGWCGACLAIPFIHWKLHEHLTQGPVCKTYTWNCMYNLTMELYVQLNLNLGTVCTSNPGNCMYNLSWELYSQLTQGTVRSIYHRLCMYNLPWELHYEHCKNWLGQNVHSWVSWCRYRFRPIWLELALKIEAHLLHFQVPPDPVPLEY